MNHGWKPGEWRTFAMDLGLTNNIVTRAANIVRRSLVSFGEKQAISDKYYRILRNLPPEPSEAPALKTKER
ncbi:hypothetical protein A2363_04410 [Candidatus Gottesmanbacteria bacterium RIFOXYB1_FULL_47_11]|uniref:Uncharacterized protein n=1 Tax=Candidatus Gottesmanbacteria bacterium RIFOXYB1_FULL_47_11 TaxID=1798401 RepID=A0A1F6BEW1_9BACT|nr:MAG: hypothetical protein A2363_04410 [Candidatus Gottesmanbacteria bacterium RIFOXYB1_FULL_47_11]